MGDFLVQPLAHFRTAVVHYDRAVLIHVHQSTGLVQEGQGKGNAKLHRRQRDAFFQDRAFGIKRLNRFATGWIVRGCDQTV